MPADTLPATAIVDPRIFTNEATLHGFLATLRASENGVHYVEAEGFRPFWVVSSHAGIVAVERDAARYINAPIQAMFSLAHQELSRKTLGDINPQDLMRNVVAMDGDEHRRYREITQAHFTPKGLLGLRQDIRAIAAEFIDRMASTNGECDFAAIAMAFPLRVILSLLGLPQEDEQMMLRLTQQTLSSEDPEFKQNGGAGGAMQRMFTYLHAIMLDRRAEPTGDLASVVANAMVYGEYLPDRDVVGYYQIIATAGHDTTSYSLTGGLLALLQHPVEFARLRADPALLPMAVEEILRWTTPVRHFCRTATADSQLAGKTIRQGDIILLSYPSANRDETTFADAATFRIDRKPNRQIAFGHGPHVCLGQYLARLELTTFFQELLTRVDDIELAGTPRFVEGTFVGGVKYLPIRYRMP